MMPEGSTPAVVTPAGVSSAGPPVAAATSPVTKT
jgi:hypothetical protein